MQCFYLTFDNNSAFHLDGTWNRFIELFILSLTFSALGKSECVCDYQERL